MSAASASSASSASSTSTFSSWLTSLFNSNATTSNKITSALFLSGLTLTTLVLYRKIKELATMQHTQLLPSSASASDSTQALTQEINQNIFPQYRKNRQGLWIFTQQWIVSNAKANVFVCHGFGEHILRYEHLARFLNAHGYNVYGMDHQGHGQSQGDRAHVIQFQDYVNDYIDFVQEVTQRDSVDRPRYLIAHSMGGCIGLHVAYQTSALWKGAVISGPAILPDPKTATPFMRFLARTLATWLPKFQADALSSKFVSRDPQVVAKYESDPLNYHGAMRVNWAFQMLNAMDDIQTNAAFHTYPFLLLHGTEDRLCLIQGSEMFFEASRSQDKTFKRYPGLYHEIFNEPEQAQVFQDVLEFLDARLPFSTKV